MSFQRFETGFSEIASALYWGRVAICHTLGLTDKEVSCNTKDLESSSPHDHEIRVRIIGPRAHADVGQTPFEAEVRIKRVGEQDFVIDRIRVYSDSLPGGKVEIILNQLPEWIEEDEPRRKAA